MITNSITDPFHISSLDTSKWTETTGGSATMSYGTTGATCNYPASSTSSTIGQLNSASTDLTGSFALLRVLSVPSAGTSADAELRLQIDANNWLRIVYEGGTLFFQKMVASSRTTVISFSYSSVNHKWWRIREKAGITYWDTSGDGFNWANQTNQANPIVVTGLSIYILGSCFQNEASPGTFKFDMFNSPGIDMESTNFYLKQGFS